VAGEGTATWQQRLEKALQDGTRLDCEGAALPGSVIRRVLLRADELQADPLGLQLVRAVIEGPLDLENLRSDVGLGLISCEFTEEVDLGDAAFPWITFNGSRGRRLSADGLRVEGPFFLREVRFHCDEGVAFRMVGARIGSNVELDGADLRSEAGPAYACDSARIEGDLYLRPDSKGREFIAKGSGSLGAIRCTRTRVDGRFECRFSTLTNRSGPALFGDFLEAGTLDFAGLRARGGGGAATVELTGARVAQNLMLARARLLNPNGPVLNAERITVEGDMICSHEFRASGGKYDNLIMLGGSRVLGDLNFSHASLKCRRGTALGGDSLSVQASLFLDEMSATGRGDGGVLRFPRAKVGGVLQMEGAEVRGEDGPAILLEGAEVGGTLFARRSFLAGTGKDGIVRLHGSTFGSSVEFDRAVIRNEGVAEADEERERSGPALYLDGVIIRGYLFLREGFQAETEAEVEAVVRVVTTTIAHELDLRQAELVNPLGPRLDLSDTSCGKLVLSTDLLGAHRAVVPRQLNLDGLSYERLTFRDQDDESYDDEESADLWREWLRGATLGYAAQPYQQLAASLRATGHQGVLLRTLIAQEDDLTHRGRSEDPLWTLRRRLLRLLLGYGYETWRAMVALALVLLLAVGLAFLAGGYLEGPYGHVAAHGSPNPYSSADCSSIELVEMALDVIPLVEFASEPSCSVETASTAGGIVTVVDWLLRLAAWALATLAVVGYTGLVRRL
jgi:hypothetical protein